MYSLNENGRVVQSLSQIFNGSGSRAWFWQALLLGVPAVFIFTFLIIPILYIGMISFWSVEQYTLIPSWTIQNYIKLLTSELYISFLIKSLIIAIGTTITCLLIGYPIAYYVARQLDTNQQLSVLLIIAAPFFIGTLIRVFAHQSLIGPSGIINMFLNIMGFEEIGMFGYNNIQTFIGETYLWLPFMILSIFLSLSNIDFNLINAATDAGASSVRAFWEVTWPLSRPGVVVGSILVFVPTLSGNVVSGFVGGPNGALIGNIINSHFGVSGEWAFGATLTVSVIILSGIFILALAQTVPWQAFYVSGDLE